MRSGSFSGPADQYGAPVDIAKPMVDTIGNTIELIQMQQDQIEELLKKMQQPPASTPAPVAPAAPPAPATTVAPTTTSTPATTKRVPRRSSR